MSRPFTDMQVAISGNEIKNGSAIVSTTFTGQHSFLDTYTKNYPVINDIYQKYGNRFYNGIFVELVGDQVVVGG